MVDKDRLTDFVGVKVTRAQKEALNDLAHEKRMDMSELVREILFSDEELAERVSFFVEGVRVSKRNDRALERSLA
jgi:hypothetical protein